MSHYGTPKTLNEAIRNGLKASHDDPYASIKGDIDRVIESHVRDFIAQKFAIAFLKYDDHLAANLRDLWRSIIQKEK